LKIFNDEAPTIIFNTLHHDIDEKILSPSPLGRAGVGLYQVTEDVSLVHQILIASYQLKIQSVIVEGGAKLLQTFIDEDMWDEARVIRNEELVIRNGLNAPVLQHFAAIAEQKIFADQITNFKRIAS
jgi:diaminohydroxyphosphoribosylaminopyrimidine deaminase / 5-amino-6-(5-phosphoribosylamino)uracil reductase